MRPLPGVRHLSALAASHPPHEHKQSPWPARLDDSLLQGSPCFGDNANMSHHATLCRTGFHCAIKSLWPNSSGSPPNRLNRLPRRTAVVSRPTYILRDQDLIRIDPTYAEWQARETA